VKSTENDEALALPIWSLRSPSGELASHPPQIEKQYRNHKLARTHDFPKFVKIVGPRRITNCGKWVLADDRKYIQSKPTSNCRKPLNAVFTLLNKWLLEGGFCNRINCTAIVGS
jgi:hypothetical protein